MPKRGDVRDDGMIFAKKANGKELWLSKDKFEEWRSKEIARAVEWQTRRAKEIGELLNAYKLSKGCEECGYKEHPYALDFDHIDPSTKHFNIGRSRAKVSIDKIWEEVAKCRVLCANCHRIKTFTNGDYYVKAV